MASPTFHTIAELGNAATAIALQLHAWGPAISSPEFHEHVPMGTATLIAPHLAITCRHVLEDYFRKYRLPEDSVEGNFFLVATMILADGKEGFDLVVKKTAISPHTDIAFLWLDGVPENTSLSGWALPQVDVFPPPVGSRIHAVGYHSATAHVDDQQRTVTISREIAIAGGDVIEIHELRRDRSRLNFPCFQTDARFDGGMSGAPVFNDRGRLCGIVCSNFPPTEPDQDHVSYVASLWPMAASIIDFGRVENPRLEPVLDLMRDGVIHSEGHEFIGLTPNPETGADPHDLRC